jgi:hypothetical protein
MSIFGRFSSFAACLLAVAAVLFVSSLPAKAANPGTIQGQALVTSVVGTANVKVGQTLAPGAVITTGSGSSVILDLGKNGNILEVKADSSVTLEVMSLSDSKSDTKINVEKGGINGNVKKLSKDSKYEVRTAKGVAGIRGTAFTIYADGTASVWAGQVTFVFIIPGRAPVTVTVSAGQSVSPPTATNPNPVVFNTPPDVTKPAIVIYNDNRPDTQNTGTAGGDGEVRITISPQTGEDA